MSMIRKWEPAFRRDHAQIKLRSLMLAAVLLPQACILRWPRRKPTTSRPMPQPKPPRRRPDQLRNQWTTTESHLRPRRRRRRRRFRCGNRRGQGSRGPGEGFDLPGDEREGTLEGDGNSLAHDPAKCVAVFRDQRKQQGAQGDLAMTIHRRDFLKLSGAAALSGGMLRAARGADSPSLYDLERFGNARILHMTDTHAQLRPVFFREPSVNHRHRRHARASRRTWSARPSSTTSASAPTAPTPMPSPRSTSRNPPRASAARRLCAI